MLRNYLLTALRSFKRNMTYATLNIFGLAIGIGCAYVLFSVIDYHLGFDKHQKNYDNIYRIVKKSIYPDRETHGMGTQHPVAPALREDYPNLKAVTRIHYAYGDQINVYNGDGTFEKYSIDEGLTFAENQFFQIFDVNWIAGNPETALTQPNTVVLALSQIEKFFGLDRASAGQALGKVVNLANQQDIEIVGIVEDPVAQTNFPFTIYIEYSTQKAINPYYRDGKNWNTISSTTNTYFLADAHFDLVGFNLTMDTFIDKYKGEGTSEIEKAIAQPLSEIHFDDVNGAYVSNMYPELLFALGVIALFLIVTASINFINLSTAQAANRAREIGIRKAIGGYIGQLRAQFMAEISVITALALVLSLAVSELMFILLEDLLEYRLTIDIIDHPYKLLILLGLFLGVSLLSGLYPSFLLSRMNTVVALKSKMSAHHAGGFNLRKGLVILQFAISQLLIIGTIVVKLQTDYFLGKDVGFEKDAIISTYIPDPDLQKLERFRSGLLSSPSISDVSLSLSEPTGNSNSWSDFNYAPLESETDYTANYKICDDRYIEFWGIELLAGRAIRQGDDTLNVVINRKIADLMGFEGRYDEALGVKFNVGWGGGDRAIVGITENFHTASLTEEIPYVIFIYDPRIWYNASFKIAAGSNPKAALDHFESSWESVFAEYVSDYSFYNESYADQYKYEINTSKLLMIFSVISILIGCLGLYGLVSFIAVNKTKEIGVRKVLGANVWNILGMFSKEILMLLVFAFVVASPIAYYFLDMLLSEIPYRINLNISYFAAGLLVTTLIAFLTISHRTISSARLNPATTLKDE